MLEGSVLEVRLDLAGRVTIPEVILEVGVTAEEMRVV